MNNKLKTILYIWLLLTLVPLIFIFSFIDTIILNHKPMEKYHEET